MVDEPHADNCQGCAADRLTEADRAYLRKHGWTHPAHTYRTPPEMPPRPLRRHGGTGALLRDWTAMYWVFCGSIAIVGGLPIDSLLYGYVIGSTLIVTWLLIGNARHHRKHPRLDRPNCRWCTGQAAQMWEDYNKMRDRQARRAHYYEYRRLQENERRYDQDST